MKAFITNFQAPFEVEDLIDRYQNHNGFTNLEILLAADGETEWTVHKDAQVGDIVFFMCAKTAKDHLGHIHQQLKNSDDPELLKYLEEEMYYYKIASGNILAVGVIANEPFQSESEFNHQNWRSPWYANIKDIAILDSLINIDCFKSFIQVSRTGAITKLDDEQYQQLVKIIKESNIIRL